MVRCEPHKEIKLIIMKCSVRKIIVVNDRNIISRHVHYVYACVYANVYKQYIWVATRTSSSSVTDPSRGGGGGMLLHPPNAMFLFQTNVLFFFN